MQRALGKLGLHSKTLAQKCKTKQKFPVFLELFSFFSCQSYLSLLPLRLSSFGNDEVGPGLCTTYGGTLILLGFGLCLLISCKTLRIRNLVEVSDVKLITHHFVVKIRSPRDPGRQAQEQLLSLGNEIYLLLNFHRMSSFSIDLSDSYWNLLQLHFPFYNPFTIIENNFYFTTIYLTEGASPPLYSKKWIGEVLRQIEGRSQCVTKFLAASTFIPKALEFL